MWRISLRQLMLLVALVAVAIVSLKYASDGWLAVIGAVTILAFFIALIVAAVDRGPRQAFAIGFALTTVSYGLIVINGQTKDAGARPRNLEFDQWEGRLPTTRLLRYVHQAVNHSKWIDYQTGKEVPNYKPTSGGGFGGGAVSSVGYSEFPPREKFMPIGHCWWGLLLGYLGGLFAVFVYRRRLREFSDSATKN